MKRKVDGQRYRMEMARTIKQGLQLLDTIPHYSHKEKLGNYFYYYFKLGN